MNIEEYDKVQLHENQYQIAIDFDGVIYKNSKGFHDGTVYDEPIDGALEAIKSLYNEGFTIVVFTGKAKSDRPHVNGKSGAELVEEWLIKYDVMKYVKEVTSEKPRALIYIDDKGYRFNNWKDTLKFIDSL